MVTFASMSVPLRSKRYASGWGNAIGYGQSSTLSRIETILFAVEVLGPQSDCDICDSVHSNIIFIKFQFVGLLMEC